MIYLIKNLSSYRFDSYLILILMNSRTDQRMRTCGLKSFEFCLTLIKVRHKYEISFTSIIIAILAYFLGPILT